MLRSSPAFITRPDSTASTSSSFAISATSLVVPLKRMTELVGLTRTFGSCENRKISESVSPSERYSTSALPLVLTKGITAIELIAPVALPIRARQKRPSPTAPAISTSTPRAAASLCFLIPVTTSPAPEAPVDNEEDGAPACEGRPPSDELSEAFVARVPAGGTVGSPMLSASSRRNAFNSMAASLID